VHSVAAPYIRSEEQINNNHCGCENILWSAIPFNCVSRTTNWILLYDINCWGATYTKHFCCSHCENENYFNKHFWMFNKNCSTLILPSSGFYRHFGIIYCDFIINMYSFTELIHKALYCDKEKCTPLYNTRRMWHKILGLN
jgi:hypothetical protein